jgi:hypothetical protein
VAAGPLGAGESGGDGWDGWEGELLTERELARLAAWDRTAGPAGERGDGDWLGWLPEEDHEAEAGAAGLPPVPGLMPRRWGRDGGFAAGGVADRVPPGPVLAGLAAAKQDEGLAAAGDDELAGLMIAWRRLTSWAAAGELAAVAELDRRRAAQAAAAGDVRQAEQVADEVAMALTLTCRAADKLTGFAAGLGRLPRTWAALRAGDIDVPRALVIAEELAGLDAPHAARLEAAVLGRAAGQTTGELRRAARRAVLAADPAAARARAEKAAGDARVECWPEQAGTAALAGRDLPPAQTLAADRRLSESARWLKQAGAEGTLDQLRARVYLALLNGRPLSSLLPSPADDAPPDSNLSRVPAADGSINPGATASGRVNPGPAAHGSVNPGPAARGSVNPGPAIRGSINLVVPLATWLGWGDSPGEVAGFGPLDAAGSRDLAAVLARDRATTWCLTITGPGARPAAHGCATTRPPQPPDTPPGRPPPQRTAGPSGRPGTPHGPGPPSPPPGIHAWLAGIRLAWLETGRCAHRRQSPGYRAAPSLAHLIQIRHQTCAAPGCRRPATACDFDHTLAYHQGGRTCECNGAPLCRRHHRAKQTPGWHLGQPRPGTLTWTTPARRSYTTHPAEYPT